MKKIQLTATKKNNEYELSFRRRNEDVFTITCDKDELIMIKSVIDKQLNK